MHFSSEPTREMVFCTTAQSEILLQKHLRTIPGWPGTAATMALNRPTRVFDHEGGFMRFWNWDTCSSGEHPVVEVLIGFARLLPENQFRLLRIVCDDNALEEAGDKSLFEHMGIKVIIAPRIVF